jgi:tetratricopeptide (TPR) repeat protein
MRQMTMEELLDWEDDWLDRDGLDEGDERNAWLEEGINLYKQFLQLDPKEPRYAIMLADLYLQWGRDEKIRRGNYLKAYEILRKATIYSPSKPDAFYHLSFILASQERKWEAVLFYGKEALEKGIDGSKRIKLLCNVALGYARLGYIQKAMEYIKEACDLDKMGEHGWFIELYMDRIKKRVTEPILLKEPEEKRKTVSKHDANKVKEDAMEGKCVVLDLARDEKYFYAYHDTVRLERKEAEILGYLIDHQMTSCPKHRIEEAIWHDRPVGSTAVKRYIASLRRKLSQAMGRDDISENILVTTDEGYEWKADIPSIVLRKG